MFDVQLDENGDLPVVTTHFDGWQLTVQRIKARLRTFLGEWVLDTAVGIPYLLWRQERGPDTTSIAAFIRVELEETPGVIRVESCEAAFTVATRTIRITARVVLEDATLGQVTVALDGGVTQNVNTSPYLTVTLFAPLGILT